MNPFEMVVMIVAIVVVGGVLRARFQQGGAASGGIDAATAAENARLHDDIAALKRRVATLERIATDRSTSLDHEIESLRDRN